jgi:hypothetical protein
MDGTHRLHQLLCDDKHAPQRWAHKCSQVHQPLSRQTIARNIFTPTHRRNNLIDQSNDLTTAAVTLQPSPPPGLTLAHEHPLEASRDKEIAMKNSQDPKPVTLDDVFEYLHTALNSFEGDPADSDFQRGYERALSDMRHDLLGISPTDRLH